MLVLPLRLTLRLTVRHKDDTIYLTFLWDPKTWIRVIYSSNSNTDMTLILWYRGAILLTI